MELFDLYTSDRQKTDRTMVRGEPTPEGCYRLVVHVCIFDSEGRMLIQQRQPFKKGWSNLWDVSVGGSAISGDSSQSAAERETLEELGLRIDPSAVRPSLTIHWEHGFDDYYNRYINRMNLNVYGTKRVFVPMPELYVIYHGDRGDRPDEIRLSKEIFGLANPADAFVDVKAKIIYDSKQGDIINQYVTFARVFDSQIVRYGYTQKAVDETIRICKDRNVLSEFLAEEEVATIMFTMADEEKARKFYEEELKTETKTSDWLEAIRALMDSMKWSATQAMDALKIPTSERATYTSML